MSRLNFLYATMGTGKSATMLREVQHYEDASRKFQLFTAALDTRAGSGIVRSRSGQQRRASTFDADTVFERDRLTPLASAVFIDEAQFLSSAQVRQLHQMAHTQGVYVYCYGLRSDFQGQAFAGSAALMALADQIQELPSLCECSQPATLNARVGEDGQRITNGPQILIGGNSRYRAMCPACFYRPASASVRCVPQLEGSPA